MSIPGFGEVAEQLCRSRLGVTLDPVRVPRAKAYTFGLVILVVEPGSPAALASLLPGDILLGAEENPFHSTLDLARSPEGCGQRRLRLEFLRGDYGRVRRVAVQIAEQVRERSSVAA
jgi:S1-C subfamily serine protease